MRKEGLIPFSANLEVKIKGELDARKFVSTYADLLAFTQDNYIPYGFTVSCAGEDNVSKRGIWMYTGQDDLQLADPAFWILVTLPVPNQLLTEISISSRDVNDEIVVSAVTGSVIKWVLNQQEFVLPSPVGNILVADADAGFNRKDILYLNDQGLLVKISGVETTDLVAIEPPLPPNAIKLTVIDIFSNVVSVGPTPIPDLTIYATRVGGNTFLDDQIFQGRVFGNPAQTAQEFVTKGQIDDLVKIIVIGGGNILSGEGDPLNTLGVDGDYYLDIETSNFWGPKTAGEWTEFTVLRGKDGYSPIKGLDYFDGLDGLRGEIGLSAYEDWKVRTGQPNGLFLDFLESIRGPQGTAGQVGQSLFDYWNLNIAGGTGTVQQFEAYFKGLKGDTGDTGADGSIIVAGGVINLISGAVDPTGADGVDGDYYLNTTTSILYGPKAGGVYPTQGVLLKGNKGDKGDDGISIPGTNGRGLDKWLPQSYVQNSLVNHVDKFWEAQVATNSGQEPGIVDETIWKEISKSPVVSDGPLGNSTTIVPSENSVKTYVNGRPTYRGSFATLSELNTIIPAATSGDYALVGDGSNQDPSGEVIVSGAASNGFERGLEYQPYLMNNKISDTSNSWNGFEYTAKANETLNFLQFDYNFGIRRIVRSGSVTRMYVAIQKYDGAAWIDLDSEEYVDPRTSGRSDNITWSYNQTLYAPTVQLLEGQKIRVAIRSNLVAGRCYGYIDTTQLSLTIEAASVATSSLYIFRNGGWTSITSDAAFEEYLATVNKFRGKYISLAALEAANPTAPAGSYAQVDEGAGFDVINYIYDAEEGWIVGSGAGGSATSDYVVVNEGGIYKAKSDRGYPEFVSADFHEVLQDAINTLSVGLGGKIHISAGAHTLSDEIIITGWDSSNPPLGRLVIEGEGYATHLIQNTANKCGIIARNKVSITLDNFRISAGVNAYEALLLSDAGADSEVSVFGGLIDNILITSNSTARPGFRMQNTFDVSFPTMSVYNPQNDAVVIESTSEATIYGNSHFGFLRTFASALHSGLRIEGYNNYKPVDMVTWSNYQCISALYGIYAKGMSSCSFDFVDIEYIKFPIYFDGTVNERENLGNNILAGYIYPQGLGAVGITMFGAASGGNNINVTIQTDGSTVPLLVDQKQFRAANTYDISASFFSDPTNYTLTEPNNTYLKIKHASSNRNLIPNPASNSNSNEVATTSWAKSLLDLKADLVGGVIPANQLPSYVDDVLEYANLAAFPATGENSKIYIALDTNITYRWGGSTYVVIGSSLALGETAQTAYRGDRGKTAYDHSQIVSGNPHGTTKADVGLPLAENTADIDKVISNPTQAALDLKQNLPNELISGGIISLPISTTIRLSAASWRVFPSIYSTAIDTDFTGINPSTSGTQRYIGFYGNTSNAIVKVEGAEGTTAAYPTQPANTAILRLVLVNDAGIDSDSPDLSGYLLKSDKASSGEIVTGTNDTKYTTALGIKNWFLSILASIVSFTNTTESTSTSTGAVKIAGGLGILKRLWTKSLSVSDFVGSEARVTVANADGSIAALYPVQTPIITNSTIISQLTTGTNWSTANIYTGSAIANATQMQYYNDATYFYYMYDDTTPVRILRSVIEATDAESLAGTLSNRFISPLRWTYLKTQIANITNRWQFTGIGIGTAGLTDIFMVLAAATSTVGQLRLVQGTVDYIGSVLGTIWNNGGEFKFIDVGRIVNRFQKVYNNALFKGTGTRVAVYNAAGDQGATDLLTEQFIQDTDIVTAILAGSYSNLTNRATITPASSKIMVQGQYYSVDNILYFAVDDNIVLRTHLSLKGAVSVAATAQTTFTVTIGVTMVNTSYFPSYTPTSMLAIGGYITNKTTTTFDVILPAATGTVTFDWIINR